MWMEGEGRPFGLMLTLLALEHWVGPRGETASVMCKTKAEALERFVKDSLE